MAFAAPTPVASRLNHARLPTWPTLDSSERYWAGWLGRHADDNGFVQEWYYGSSAFLHRYDLGERQTEGFLVESILSALTHQETRIAYRSLLQAAGYIGTMGESANRFLDAYRVAQSRVEALLFPRA